MGRETKTYCPWFEDRINGTVGETIPVLLLVRETIMALFLVLAQGINTDELGYDGPLYDGFLHMTDDMLGPSPMHIKYSSYVYDGFCI